MRQYMARVDGSAHTNMIVVGAGHCQIWKYWAFQPVNTLSYQQNTGDKMFEFTVGFVIGYGLMTYGIHIIREYVRQNI